MAATDAPAGFHVHGLSGFFGPDHGHIDTAQISVTVNRLDGPRVVGEPVAVPGSGSVVTSPDGRSAYQVSRAGTTTVAMHW